MGYVFANYASATLSQQLGSGDNLAYISLTDGAEFPDPQAGEFFVVSIEDTNGNVEYARCTARTSDANNSILQLSQRGIEDTSPTTFPAGARVELRATRDTFAEFLQRSGDTLAGNLDAAGNSIVNPVIDGGTAEALTLRDSQGNTQYEMAFPDAALPTVGGVDIALISDLATYLAADDNVTITGDWDFTGLLELNGITVATLDDIPTKNTTNKLETVPKSSSYTLTTADLYKKIILTASATADATFDMPASYGSLGDLIFFENQSDYILTIQQNATGAYIRDRDATTGNLTITGKYKSVGLHKSLASYWAASGDYD